MREPRARYGLWNARTGEQVAGTVVGAFDSSSRRQGLLGRGGLGPGEALILDRGGRVLKTSSGVRPWRVRAAWRAFAVVELAAGSLERSGTAPGDVVELRTIV